MTKVLVRVLDSLVEEERSKGVYFNRSRLISKILADTVMTNHVESLVKEYHNNNEIPSTQLTARIIE